MASNLFHHQKRGTVPLYLKAYIPHFYMLLGSFYSVIPKANNSELITTEGSATGDEQDSLSREL